MGNITAVTRGGVVYEPSFVVDINQLDCISCGRCYKVCPRQVLELVDRTAEMMRSRDEDDDDDDDWDDDEEDSDATMMAITNAMDCIGCEACARVCPKKCFVNQPLPMGS
jgi:Nif-specific ferredoxin III